MPHAEQEMITLPEHLISLPDVWEFTLYYKQYCLWFIGLWSFDKYLVLFCPLIWARLWWTKYCMWNIFLFEVVLNCVYLKSALHCPLFTVCIGCPHIAVCIRGPQLACVCSVLILPGVCEVFVLLCVKEVRICMVKTSRLIFVVQNQKFGYAILVLKRDVYWNISFLLNV